MDAYYYPPLTVLNEETYYTVDNNTLLCERYVLKYQFTKFGTGKIAVLKMLPPPN